MNRSIIISISRFFHQKKTVINDFNVIENLDLGDNGNGHEDSHLIQ